MMGADGRVESDGNSVRLGKQALIIAGDRCPAARQLNAP